MPLPSKQQHGDRQGAFFTPQRWRDHFHQYQVANFSSGFEPPAEKPARQLAVPVAIKWSELTWAALGSVMERSWT